MSAPVASLFPPSTARSQSETGVQTGARPSTSDPGTSNPTSNPTSDPTPLPTQLPRGRLIELSGDRSTAHLSAAVACLRHAQVHGETTAWVQPAGGPLFPPDLHDSGIDLGALLVVHVPPSAGAHGLPKATELLLRSGGFGLVVMDLSGLRPSGDAAWQGRLLGLAREHNAWLLMLSERGPLAPPRTRTRAHQSNQTTHAPHASLGPLVSLCLSPTRTRQAPGRFTLTPVVRKDKSGSLGALYPETRRGPWGLL